MMPQLAAETVITCGSDASIIVTPAETTTVPVEKDVPVVDTTGAGDLFAGGYLYGRQQGLGQDVSARIGALAAAEVISHYGARPETSLAGLISSRDDLS